MRQRLGDEHAVERSTRGGRHGSHDRRVQERYQRRPADIKLEISILTSQYAEI